MATAWRLVKTKFVAVAFDGEGARLYGGRWNSPGTRVVYLADSVSLAILEVLVHTEDVSLLAAYSICDVSYDPALATTVAYESLPPDWDAVPSTDATQAIGDDWVASATSVLLRVPSVVAPGEFNLLVNPAHRKSPELAIGEFEPFRFDKRLTGSGSRARTSGARRPRSSKPA
jgi:RES domain-containing protein